jgi:hypothetical protein
VNLAHKKLLYYINHGNYEPDIISKAQHIRNRQAVKRILREALDMRGDGALR